MSDYLPPELWSKVLLKLVPIRSVIQCTAVCKQWRSIITSSAFISAHLHLSRQNPLLLSPPTTISTPNTFCLHFDTDDSPLPFSHTLNCPFRTYRENDVYSSGRVVEFRVVGSVDGLVLLSDDLRRKNYNNMIIWNPSIRKSVTLPMPRFNSDSLALPHYRSVLGFAASGDYKVVRVVYPEESAAPDLLVEVYSLRDRRWRTVISSIVDHLAPPFHWTQCFIHGAVHWIGLKAQQNQLRDHEEILVFDVEKEEFKKMALPQAEIATKANLFTISVVGGLLTVSVNRGNLANHINIWVKTDYYAESWTKIASLDAWKLRVWEWLALRRVCWGAGGDCRDIQVHPVSTFLTDFCVGKTIYDDCVFSYTESLVLLQEDRPVQEAT